VIEAQLHTLVFQKVNNILGGRCRQVSLTKTRLARGPIPSLSQCPYETSGRLRQVTGSTVCRPWQLAFGCAVVLSQIIGL
jgi:hypothetical protein